MAEVSATGRALASAIKKYGLTQKQAGAMLGVSDRMVRQILSGAKPGRNVETAARQLAREGRITSPPARREQRVRAPGGRTAPAPVPVEGVRSVEAGGRAQTTVRAPGRGLGREAARRAILDDLRARRGGVRGRGGSRVRFQVTTKDGRTFTVGGKGGYDPKAVAARMRAEGDDPFEWIADEVSNSTSYAGAGVTPAAIATVTLTYF